MDEKSAVLKDFGYVVGMWETVEKIWKKVAERETPSRERYIPLPLLPRHPKRNLFPDR